MATLFVHIQVKDGCESEFEALAAELYRATHEHDSGCLRYEYWRAAEPGLYYSLLCFEDFRAFLRHQVSDHHESASPRIGELCETLKLEWVDPIPGASPLPATEMQALPETADEKTALYHKVFAATVQGWWPR
jgi:quinol monooxygenase YgiN